MAGTVACGSLEQVFDIIDCCLDVALLVLDPAFDACHLSFQLDHTGFPLFPQISHTNDARFDPPFETPGTSLPQVLDLSFQVILALPTGRDFVTQFIQFCTAFDRWNLEGLQG